MDISGKIIAVLPVTTGQGKNGIWRSLDFVLETGDQYPKKVCINLFNDKIDKFPVAVNDEVTVSFDIDAREYNGRWYNSVKAWNVKNKNESPVLGNLPKSDIIGEPPADFTAPFSLNDSGDSPFPF